MPGGDAAAPVRPMPLSSFTSVGSALADACSPASHRSAHAVRANRQRASSARARHAKAFVRFAAAAASAARATVRVPEAMQGGQALP